MTANGLIGEQLRPECNLKVRDPLYDTLARLALVCTVYLATFNFLDQSDTAAVMRLVRSKGPVRRAILESELSELTA